MLNLKYLNKACLKSKAMKRSSVLLMGLILLGSVNISSTVEVNNDQTNKHSIDVYCTPDLLDLSNSLAIEYCNLNFDLEINVINIPESKFAETIGGSNNLGFITNEQYTGLKGSAFWKVAVGRDVIIPIMNSKNPFLSEIYEQGISSEDLAQTLCNEKLRNWGKLLENGKYAPIHYYFIKDESIDSDVANFLNVDPGSFKGIKVENENDLIYSIQKDPLAIAFCKMINLVNYKNQIGFDDIKLLPIDRNGNGKIDYIEQIYDDLNDLSRGVWIGKYPKKLYKNIYVTSAVKPTNEIEVAFLKWVLTEGQDFMNSTGYSELTFSERQRKLDDLVYYEIGDITSNEAYASNKLFVLLILGFIVTAFFSTFIIRKLKRTKVAVSSATSIYPLVFDENSIEVPKGLYYDKTHTWAFMEKNGIVRIGIDDFLQHVTGPLTRIKMKEPGLKIKKGDQLLSIIHKGKQLHINAPISGIIKAQNKTLYKDSSLINSSPYSEGWVYMINPTNWISEIRFLFMDQKYRDWLKNEFSRLKDFLAVTIKPNSVEPAYGVFQDGGELKKGILADFGPEIWEDFQTNFIDTSI